MEEEIIIKKGDTEFVLTEGRIKDLTSKFLEACGNQATLYDDFNINSKMVDMLINVKKAWYPATQKNLNVNVNAFENKMDKWMKVRKELNVAKTDEQVITIE